MKAYVNQAEARHSRQRPSPRTGSKPRGPVTFSDDPYFGSAPEHRLRRADRALEGTAHALIDGHRQGHFDGHRPFPRDQRARAQRSQRPRIKKVQEIIRNQGLGAALEYAKAYPDLMDKIVRPDRKKVVVLFTDGQSNTGIEPIRRGRHRQELGVRVYTIGIAPKGVSVGDYDEKTLPRWPR